MVLIVRPDGAVETKSVETAILTTNSLRVGTLSNHKPNASLLLSLMQERIMEKLGSGVSALESLHREKPYASMPVDPAVLLDLSEHADLVLVGSGD